MTTVALTRTLSGLSPADDAATHVLQKIKAGETVQAEIRRPRSNKNLRRWWALCRLIYENSDQYRSQEQVHDHLKILAGHCQQIVSKSTGEVYLIADSIAFSRLDEDEFQDVWVRAVKAVTEHILPGVTAPEIENEILRLIGASTWQ